MWVKGVFSKIWGVILEYMRIYLSASVYGVSVANTHSFFALTVARRLTAIIMGALRYCIAIAPLSTPKLFFGHAPDARLPSCPGTR
jgi:hypothetical protein